MFLKNQKEFKRERPRNHHKCKKESSTNELTRQIKLLEKEMKIIKRNWPNQVDFGRLLLFPPPWRAKKPAFIRQSVMNSLFFPPWKSFSLYSGLFAERRAMLFLGS